MYDFQIVSTTLQNRARIFDNGEACWNRRDIEGVLEEVAAANRLIVGLDICTFPGGRATPRLEGGSELDVDASKHLPWPEQVALGLESALRDVARTAELANLQPPHDDVWYIVTSIGENE
jgi:hypothetical protein